MSTNNNKHSFMPIRDGAGSFDLDNPEDGTPIREMISLKNRLLLVTDKCTYEVQLADQIDPKRTNPNLPHNVRRKLLDYGILSETLCKVLLQGKTLFRKEYLTVDVENAMHLAATAMEQYASLEHLVAEFKSLEKSEIDRFSASKQQARSVALPSLGHVDSYCKTFAQRAHHFGRTMLELVRLFYPAASNWDKLHEIVSGKFGSDDQFARFVAAITPEMTLILRLRDCIEHQLSGVTTRDFALEVDGSIAPPTIELHFKKSKLPRCSISILMDDLTSDLVSNFEQLIVHMCAKSVHPFGGMQSLVVEVPEEQRKIRHVRYGYGLTMQDGTVAFSV